MARMDLSSQALTTAFIIGTSAIALIGAGHALLRKRRPQSALGWIVVCLLIPVFGPLLYFLFGINRVHLRAQRLRELWRESEEHQEARDQLSERFLGLCHLSRAVTGRPLLAGNTVRLLENGEQAFPEMLDAIRSAKTRILLSSYIFDNDATGREFIDALAQAVKRGVTVRVLVDGFGNLYSWPSAHRMMKRRGIPVTRFLPPRLIPPSFYLNLRNHRKLLIKDGETGFTGGMNIREHHLVEAGGRSRVADIHFKLTGPVVRQMERVFRRDWQFAAGEPVHGPTTHAAYRPGKSLCRVIEDGPGENLDKLPTILVGAVATARESIEIMTPYFLPPNELVAALQTAALRGVETTVILPGSNNLFYVHWATRNMLWELLQRGVRIYYQPPPFVHSKLFIIDGEYAQIGSANLDPRSLRLNFELNIEIFDAVFVRSLAEHFRSARSRSREVSLQDMDSRRLPAKFRDALAWLFSPYL